MTLICIFGGAWGKMIHGKNLKQNISFNPFNISLLSGPTTDSLTCRFAATSGAAPADSAAVDLGPREDPPVAHGVVPRQALRHAQLLTSGVGPAGKGRH